MSEPFWKVKHGWWMQDIKHKLKEIWDFKLMLRKHPDDEIGVRFREQIKIEERDLEEILKEYKRVYGTRVNIRKLRKEIEEER